MKKKKDFTIDDLALMTAQGFNEVDNKFDEMRKEVREGFRLMSEEIVDLKSDVSILKDDMVWVKNILEKHTGFLQRLDEERIFTLNYVNRLEKEIEFVKKRLKIA